MKIILVCGGDINLISWSIEHIHASLDTSDPSNNEDICNVQAFTVDISSKEHLELPSSRPIYQKDVDPQIDDAFHNLWWRIPESHFLVY